MNLDHKLLEEIYDKAISGSEYMKQVECEISRQLEPVLSDYKEKLPEQTFLELEEIVVGGTVAAEKASFIAGVIYGLNLFKEGCHAEAGEMPEFIINPKKQI